MQLWTAITRHWVNKKKFRNRLGLEFRSRHTLLPQIGNSSILEERSIYTDNNFTDREEEDHKQSWETLILKELRNYNGKLFLCPPQK